KGKPTMASKGQAMDAHTISPSITATSVVANSIVRVLKCHCRKSHGTNVNVAAKQTRNQSGSRGGFLQSQSTLCDIHFIALQEYCTTSFRRQSATPRLRTPVAQVRTQSGHLLKNDRS